MLAPQTMLASSKPLFIVGSEKNAGKTVTLNHLRAEMQLSGQIGFGLVTTGWDGEGRDHLTGGEKPRVTAYPNDIVLTAADLLTRSSARFELLWSDSQRGQAGRLVLGRCVRSGEVELVGAPSVAMLAAIITRIHSLGVRRVLVDGAADRRTPISAFPGCQVGLAFRPRPHQSTEALTAEIEGQVSLYYLDETTLKRPKHLDGDEVAFALPNGNWDCVTRHAVEAGELPEHVESVWIGGPFTPLLSEVLLDAGCRCIIVDDPSRIFVPPRRIEQLKRRGLAIQLGVRPELVFVSLRTNGGEQRSLPPIATLRALRSRLNEIPCFDPWLIEPEREGKDESAT